MRNLICGGVGFGTGIAGALLALARPTGYGEDRADE